MSNYEDALRFAEQRELAAKELKVALKFMDKIFGEFLAKRAAKKSLSGENL